MIDLHAHILPKMDDGSASVEESIEMLTLMRKGGITTVVATPHFDMSRDSLDQFLRRRENSYARLMEATRDLEVPKVLLGAEVLYCGVGLSRIENVEKLCLGEGRYMLIETLKRSWDTVFITDMQKLMAEQNITPVLAHVERYTGNRKNKKMLGFLHRDGILTQTNASVFLDKRASRKGFKFLQDNRIHLLGSDCHNMSLRKPNLAEAIAVIENKLGEDYVGRLMARAKHVVFGSNL